MMAKSLVGCDVLPAAAHLTASMLSGAHPTVKYKSSSIFTVAYGKQENGQIALGSLDLLDPQRKVEILDITAKAAEGMGEAERELWSSLPHESFNLVLMNPPFTRATGHEGNKIGVPNPMFAAFSSSEEEQAEMGAATKKLIKGTSAHGNAGEASIFLVLADRKLCQGGTLGLVMPLSLLAGKAWEKSRRLLSQRYESPVIASIAGYSNSEMSFSADTGMGECIFVGKKGSGAGRAVFVVLRETPPFPLVGWSLANQLTALRTAGQVRKLEEGPYGGTELRFGNQAVGYAVDAPLPLDGGWNVARVADISLAQTAYQLAHCGVVWLPGIKKTDSSNLAIVALKDLAKIGPYHSDVNGRTQNGGVRGPFNLVPIQIGTAPTYPVLWAHDNERERSIRFDPDKQAQHKIGRDIYETELIDTKADNIWNTASHAHFNQNFRFNSQSTAMQFTPLPSIGGRAWTSIKLDNARLEKAIVLWGNSTLGLILHWWHSNKQQAGRGNVTKTLLPTLPVLNVATLSEDQQKQIDILFEEFADKPLLPLNELTADCVRRDLDVKLLRDVLNLPSKLFDKNGALDLVRAKLCLEPSVQGGKGNDGDEGELDEDEDDED